VEQVLPDAGVALVDGRHRDAERLRHVRPRLVLEVARLDEAPLLVVEAPDLPVPRLDELPGL
jgi:hypothetical protein